MHTFAPALIAAALVTLTSAAPVGLPVNLPANLAAGVPPAALPANLSSVPLPPGVIPPIGQVTSVEGEVGSVTGTVRVRDVTSKITDAVKSIGAKVPDIDARDAQLSVAVIFDDILTEIQPYTEQLTYLVPSNCTIDAIVDVVASIKAPIFAAIPELQALVGVEAGIVLAPVDATVGSAELTVSQVATIVGGDVELVLAAAGNVLTIVKAQGGDIVADVEDVLADLGITVTCLVGAVLPLVDGLAASLTPLLAPVDVVISELNLTELEVLLGLSV